MSSLSVADLYRTGLGGISSPATERPLEKGGAGQGTGKLSGPSEFQEILKKETVKSAPLQLSQHAETRIKSREIPWTPEIEKRISTGIDQAQSKGSREALILADDVAVIANVKSRTIVTAMDRSQMKERIFTNIDSAVLV